MKIKSSPQLIKKSTKNEMNKKKTDFFSINKISFKRSNIKRALIAFLLCILFALSILIPALANDGLQINIDVPSRTLQLTRHGYLIKEFPVGVGNSKANMTPPGLYSVSKKIINPVWEHPYKAPGESRIGSGQKNPLGTRWIGFYAKGGGVFGVHGTNEPSSIGHFVSHGCVRMFNENVEELFELVEVGTPVRVTYNRFRLGTNGNTTTLEIFPDPYHYSSLKEEEIIKKIRETEPLSSIDYEMIKKAISEASESAIYEVAVKRSPYAGYEYQSPPLNQQMNQLPNNYFQQPGIVGIPNGSQIINGGPRIYRPSAY
jgi:hypothetical protein